MTAPTPYSMPSAGLIDSSGFNVGVHDVLNFLLNQPSCTLRQTVLQSVTTSTFTAITFDVEDADNVNGHSTSTNTSRYTAVYAGWYLCGGSVGIAASATGQRAAAWSVNGTLINAAGSFINTTAAGGINIPAPMQRVFLNVGDYVELKGFQSSGGSLNTVVTANNQSCMTVQWIGAS